MQVLIKETTFEDGRDQRPSYIVTSGRVGSHIVMAEILVKGRKDKLNTDSRRSNIIIRGVVRSQSHSGAYQHIKKIAGTGRDYVGWSQNGFTGVPQGR